MKKLLSLLLFVALGFCAKSQTISLTVVTAPCDSNGVLVATFGSSSPPYDVYWYTGGTSSTVHAGITTSTDTLRGYMGGEVRLSGWVIGTSTSVGPIDTIINLPFGLTDSAFNGVCPALGRLHAAVTGGTGPFNYEWINSATSAIVSTSNPASVPAGNYYIKVTDAGTGCHRTEHDSLSVYIAPDFSESVTTTPAVCPALGSALATISGGTGPFTYQWYNYTTSTLVSTSNPASLPGGVYLLTITDFTGCVGTDYTEIMVTPDFTASVTTTDANCADGTATAVITGGTGPFSYHWCTGATTSGITGLVQGYYVLLITDALGCSNDSTTGGLVNQAITIDVHDVTVPATCLDTNGSITAFGSGGTPPYSFLWSNGATTASVGSLTAGWLGVTVTDVHGCTGTGGDYITTSTPITVTYATTASSCTSPTGSATLTITGGTGPYTIDWYTTPAQHGTTATALPPGYYSFHITDALGCTQSGTVYVPPVDVINLAFSSSPATCLLSNGSVSVTASSGVPPYTYSWSSGATTASVTGLPHGLYYATVTDHNGCTVTNCQWVPYSSPLVLGLSTTPASCIYNHDGSIVATASMGTPPYTFSPGGTSSGSVTISGLATDPYWVEVTDASGCTAEDYTYVGYNEYDSSCFCLVKGTVYHDLNHNCIQDFGEVGIEHVQMHCSGLGYTYTDLYGNYYFLAPSGSYAISQRILAFYPLATCQLNNIPYTAVATTGCNTTIDFADTLDPIHDMHISTWDYNYAVPGFGYTQVSVVSNMGTVSESNILAGYKPDGQLYAPTFVPSGIFTGSSYYYNTSGTFPTMAPGGAQSFLMNYTVPTDIPLGTVVNFKDSVSYNSPMADWLLDYSPWDNVNNFNTTVVASHDPNFKEVSPKGVGSYGYIQYENDSVLEYMVHFQNTGNFMAQNVVVKDTLSPNLDWTTLTPIFLSNKGTVQMNESGAVTFSFPDINLPPARTEPVTSNALFTYRIKLRTGLAVGTQIKNKASIYFDYNAPIETNTTLNTIGVQTLVKNTSGPSESGFNLYPNPATNTCMAAINSEINGNAELAITDLEGRTIVSRTITLVTGQQNIPLNVASLTSGVYFVTIYGNGNTKTQKLVIMK